MCIFSTKFSTFFANSVIHSLVLIPSLHQRTDHLLVFKRLHDEVGGTFLDACYGKLDVGIGGKEHHLGFRAEALDFPEPVQSLVSRIDSAGEVHVEQHHVGMLLSQLGWDGVRVGDGDDAIEYGFQQHPHRSKNVAVVINNQYRSLFLYHGAKLRNIIEKRSLLSNY